MSPLTRPDPQQRPQIVARLHKMVQRWPTVSGCHLNPDPEIVEGIVGALTQSVLDTGYPYCPCRDRSGDPERDQELICPCAFHQEELRRDSHCKCVLFVSDSYDPEKAYAPLPTTLWAESGPLRALVQQQVTVYLTHWCGQSRRTKRWLELHQIPFTEIDIDADEAAADIVRQYNDGNRSVPTVVVDLLIKEPSTAELGRVLLAPGATIMRCDSYVTNWCSHSRRTLAWLRQQGIPMRMIDIEADGASARQLREWHHGYQSVPTLDIQMRMTEPTSDELERLLGSG